jgi:anaerobic ribonucleoside-triphosphate reductase
MKELERIDEEIIELNEKMCNPDLAAGTAHTMTRVSGYVRAIDNFNVGKIQEYRERLEYVL